MKFFSECTAGKTSRVAVASMVFQSLTLLWMCVIFFQLSEASKGPQELQQEEDYDYDVLKIDSKKNKDLEEEEVESDKITTIKSKSAAVGVIPDFDDEEGDIAIFSGVSEDESSISRNEEISEGGISYDNSKDDGDDGDDGEGDDDNSYANANIETDDIETTAAETQPLTIGTAEEGGNENEDASNVLTIDTNENATEEEKEEVSPPNVANLLKELSFLT